tara:strand:+ start:51 stop:248 length:198 start_codon:yes stop_codon:yes gene_type:complete
MGKYLAPEKSSPEQDNNWSLIQQLPWQGEIITCWIWDRLITWRGPEALETDQRTERQASSDKQQA